MPRGGDAGSAHGRCARATGIASKQTAWTRSSAATCNCCCWRTVGGRRGAVGGVPAANDSYLLHQTAQLGTSAYSALSPPAASLAKAATITLTWATLYEPPTIAGARAAAALYRVDVARRVWLKRRGVSRFRTMEDDARRASGSGTAAEERCALRVGCAGLGGALFIVVRLSLGTMGVGVGGGVSATRFHPAI